MVHGLWWRTAQGALFVTLITPLHSQGAWSPTPTSGNVAKLARHCAAYDLHRERLVVFGGHDEHYIAQFTTYDFDGVTWTPMIPVISPPARVGAALTYDAVRGRVVLFGGSPSNQNSFNFQDTWEYDGSTWSFRLPAIRPAPRVDHAMCYDLANRCVVLYGGRRDPFSNHGDTWTWDGASWQQHTGSGPGPRSLHAVAYDLPRSRIVLFGGHNLNTTFGDTWEWNGTNWSQIFPATAPAARSGHAMAHDLGRGVTILHGGMPMSVGSETWEWDGVDWTQHGSTSSPKTAHVLVFDARLQRTTLQGGMHTVNPMPLFADAETYGHPNPGVFVSRGTSCAGSSGTPTLHAPGNGSGPAMGQTSAVHVTAAWLRTFFALGWSDRRDGAIPLPHDLTGYGMPGCSLQVSQDAITSRYPHLGVTSLSIAIPNSPFLVGQQFFVQAFNLDPQANARGFTSTNHLMAMIGRP
ncbi:MAG: kelch repeat-containing protein [bacterium]|nr:kelch repeat-containing protein [bacterium]